GSVVFDRSLGLELLGTGMASRHHVLGAIFDPFDRPAGFHGEERDHDDIFPDQMDLLAETAADVGNDDAYILQAKRFSHPIVDDFGNLSSYPNRQFLAGGIVGSDDDEGFKRRRAVAVYL